MRNGRTMLIIFSNLLGNLNGHYLPIPKISL